MHLKNFLKGALPHCKGKHQPSKSHITSGTFLNIKVMVVATPLCVHLSIIFSIQRERQGVTSPIYLLVPFVCVWLAMQFMAVIF